MENEDLIREYINTRGLKKTTYHITKSILNHYSKYQQLTLQELLIEADTEEEKSVRWKHRRLKTRLINYMNYCKSTMRLSSAKQYFLTVKSFYRHHEIEIHHLPPLNKKNSVISPAMTYNDLPDTNLIREAIKIANPVMTAIIFMLSTSGMSKVDCLKLSINDFIISTSKYHDKEKIEDVIPVLKNQKNIIPIWKNRRSKTNKYFITFNTPECTNAILDYLTWRMQKEKIGGDDKLFKIDKNYYTLKFEEINQTLNAGRAGTYNRFRGHNLRKFHASNLEKSGMNRNYINLMQGKSNGAVDEVYFFIDEKKLYDEYYKHMDCLFINDAPTGVVDELEVLQDENRLLREKLVKINELENQINDLKSWWVKD